MPNFLNGYSIPSHRFSSLRIITDYIGFAILRPMIADVLAWITVVAGTFVFVALCLGLLLLSRKL